MQTVDYNLKISDELLDLKEMTLTIKSQDIFKDLKEVLESFSLKIENIDGAAAMVGRLHGLTKKLIDENKNLLSLKCIIHQEALCAKLGIKSGKAFSNEIMNWLTFSYLKAQQSTESFADSWKKTILLSKISRKIQNGLQSFLSSQI